MTHWTKSLALGALAAVSTVALTLPAQAVDFSGKTIEWIVPFREGGGTDRLTRILQPKLAALLPGNPTVLVLNQPGGGSIKASNKFHRSAPSDGTMLFTASTLALGAALQGNNLLTGELSIVSAAALVPALIGMVFGQRIRQSLSEEKFRKVFFIALLLLGAYIIASALTGA